MTLTLDLSDELKERLQAEAARRGLSTDTYAVQVLDSEVPASTGPANGAELVEYWEREGLIGTRPEIKDSVEHARAIRREAESRKHS
jgi:plasmid stability protein